MSRYDGVLLCSDFDGTLFFNETISDENCEAIRYFQENGGLFTLATGRFPNKFRQYEELFVPNTHVVGLNGAIIYSLTESRPVFAGEMPRSAYEFAASVMGAVPEIRELMYFSFDDHRIIARDCFDPNFRFEPTAKLVFMVDAENSDVARRAIGKLSDKYGFSCSRSSIRGIEVTRGDCTKGDSVRRLAGMLGGRAETVVCVGDYENDLRMIELADIGYAVGNAEEKLKVASDKVTVPYNEHAIARIIYEL